MRCWGSMGRGGGEGEELEGMGVCVCTGKKGSVGEREGEDTRQKQEHSENTPTGMQSSISNNNSSSGGERAKEKRKKKKRKKEKPEKTGMETTATFSNKSIRSGCVLKKEGESAKSRNTNKS